MTADHLIFKLPDLAPAFCQTAFIYQYNGRRSHYHGSHENNGIDDEIECKLHL
jgi:hypothetical protein